MLSESDIEELKLIAARFPDVFPIESYADVSAWGQDFWNQFLCRPKFLRWIAKLAMGKYAYRELYGMKEAIQNHKHLIGPEYSLPETMDYYAEKVDLG